MQIKRSIITNVPNEVKFVDEFTLRFGDDGLHVIFRSALFEKFMQSQEIRSVLLKEGYSRDIENIFLLDGMEMRELHSEFTRKTRLFHGTSRLSTPNGDGIFSPNMSWLSLVGLDKGIDVKVIYPVSVPEAEDYFQQCMGALQNFYLDWVRAVSFNGSLSEIADGD